MSARTQPALSVSDTRNCCLLGESPTFVQWSVVRCCVREIFVIICRRQLARPATVLWVSPLRLLNQGERSRGLTWPNLMYYPGMCLEGLRKPAKASRTIGVTAEIRTKHRPKRCHDCYRLNHCGRWLTIVFRHSQDRRQEIRSINEPQFFEPTGRGG